MWLGKSVATGIQAQELRAQAAVLCVFDQGRLL